MEKAEGRIRPEMKAVEQLLGLWLYTLLLSILLIQIYHRSDPPCLEMLNGFFFRYNIRILGIQVKQICIVNLRAPISTSGLNNLPNVKQSAFAVSIRERGWQRSSP